MSGPAPVLRVRLKRGREKSVLEGHPWLFSGAIETVDGPPDAPLARVEDAAGRPLGVGLWSPRSQIRVRFLSRQAQAAIDRSFFAARLEEAAALRRAVLPAETTGYRLVNAEGDGLPGWTVDRYGSVLVSQVTAAGLAALSGDAYAALAELCPGLPIHESNRVPARRAEGLPQEDRAILPEILGEPPAEAAFAESGLAFTAEVAAGQKTGFYLDQRENRRLVERLAGGRSVLDLFAHSGAFGVYAARGGAGRLVHVESAPRLAERGRRHYAANGFPEERAEWVRANVFEDLRERRDTFGMVVCDPPPLVRRQEDVNAGGRAYKDLNRLALSRVEPGGLLLTFTCSGAMDAKLFRQVLFAAAVEAGVRVALLEPLAAAPDHPVSIRHPQGEYLKGWLCSVAGPVV